MQEIAVKAAKKALKKLGDNGSTKLADLSETVAKKLKKKSDSILVEPEQVTKWIQTSSKFSVIENIVSLRRKRSNSPKDASEELLRSSKKLKPIPTDDDESCIAPTLPSQWRTQNKVVLLHTTDDEAGQKLTKYLNENEAFTPFTTFDDPACIGALAAPLLKQCTTNGFVKPSPIQAQSWPILTHNDQKVSRDMVGIAETGSGKTLAFSLPALSSMANAPASNQRRKLPRMLVLSPTRELAMQSDQVLQEFGAVVGIQSLVVYGGVPKYTQTNELKKGVDCIVATPGRLKDLIQEGNCDLSHIQHLVLDEADRLLDMGFEEDVKFIIRQCPTCEKGRQTVMFSATWPAAIQKIAMEYMNSPVRVYVGFEAIVSTSNKSEGNETNDSNLQNSGAITVDDSLSANKRVQQIVLVLEDRQREGKLGDLLRQVHGKRNNRVLVFALYKKEVERLEHSLRRQGWNCCSIHGNKNQAARTQALAEFKDGKCPLMIATDVAARGLDIPNVEVVINYTFPLTIEDYVHRIGR